MSWVPSAAILGTLLVVAVVVSLHRPFVLLGPRERRALVRAAALAVTAQAAHFAEELVTGFAERFPGLFGVEPLTRPAFVAFNVAWLSVWGVAAALAPRGARGAEWPLWFLAMALVVNGVGHPLVALVVGGYFPGLATAVPAGVAGAALLRRLGRASAPLPGARA